MHKKYARACLCVSVCVCDERVCDDAPSYSFLCRRFTLIERKGWGLSLSPRFFSLKKFITLSRFSLKNSLSKNVFGGIVCLGLFTLFLKGAFFFPKQLIKTPKKQEQRMMFFFASKGAITK